MPIPEFIVNLRTKIGTDLLWLPGVTAVVLNDHGQILLGQRSDSGRWALISGILEPGEEPALAMVREIEEETGVKAQVEALIAVQSQEPMTYPNGDEAQFLDLLFLARAYDGEPYAADDESLAVAWFDLDDLPENLAYFTLERLHAYARFTQNPADGPIFVR